MKNYIFLWIRRCLPANFWIFDVIKKEAKRGEWGEVILDVFMFLVISAMVLFVSILAAFGVYYLVIDTPIAAFVLFVVLPFIGWLVYKVATAEEAEEDGV